MKPIYVNTAKAIFFVIVIFYIIVAVAVLVLPYYRNIFTLISCLSTIFTLSLCCAYSLLTFAKKQLFDGLLQIIAFAGMLLVYSVYLKNEFNFISTSFNFISLGFDFFTSLFSFLIIRNFSRSVSNDRASS